jgi:hypothetical protein
MDSILKMRGDYGLPHGITPDGPTVERGLGAGRLASLFSKIGEHTGATDGIAAAFDAGDYMRVALEGRPEQWQYHAARGLIRDPDASIVALERFDHPAARFYSAVLAWMAGRDDEACRGLGVFKDDHACNLRALIAKPHIKVLAQLPPVRHGAHVLAEGVRRDTKFKIANVGYLDGDIPNAPYRSVHELTRSLGTPDFYVCYAVEWHEIPVDLQELTCPTIAFSNDFDMHIQGVARWLPVFDYRVVIDHVVEWPKVSAIGRGPTASYPIVFGVPDHLGDFRECARDIDVFISGTMLSAYHPDKSRQLHQIFAIPGIKLAVIDGHLSTGMYMDILARSKITPTFCRHRGGIQTRVIESLAMGSISVVQPDSIMKLWLNESNGLFEYDENVGPRPVIERILANYDTIGADCRNAIVTLRQAFEPRSVASRFLRFCTFLATKSRSRRPARDRWLNQKRVHFAHAVQLTPAVAVVLAQQNRARLTNEYAATPSGRVLIDRAREHLLLYARALYDGRRDAAQPEYLETAIAELRTACAQFPNSLVAHFDLLRVLIHFGSTADRQSIEDLASEILVKPAGFWRADPYEDVLPYDLFSNWFDYRAYLDLVVERLAGDSMPDANLNNLILAAVNHYAAVLTGSTEKAEQAVAFNPDFPFFKLTLAEMLARRPLPEQQERAEVLLRELAGSSIVAVRAYWQLQALKERNGSSGRTADDLGSRIRHMEESLIQTEHHHLKVTSPYFQMDNVRRGINRGPLIHKATPRGLRPQISVVVCGLAGHQCGALLASLHYQNIPRSRFELLYVDCYDAPEDSILRLTDWSASLNQRDFLDHRAAALNFAINHCQSEVIGIVTPGKPMISTFLSNLLAAFYGTSPGYTSASPRNVLVIVPGGGTGQNIVRSIAFHVEDYKRVGGIDQREIFMGNDAALDDLAARLNGAHVPALVVAGSGLVLRRLPSWWRGKTLPCSQHLIDMSRKIWPELFDELLIHRGMLQPPQLVEEHRGNNIVWYNSFYYVTPHRLGAPDWENVTKNGHAEIFVTASLDEARRVASQGRRPVVV